MSTSGSPRALGDLRERSREQLANIRPDEYSIKTWITTARVAFEHAEQHWLEGSRNNDHRKVEDAYLEFKKAAG
ncbi:uncharacterized protein JCM6883_000087 [Sporobolomyces salmoneus]|uniref:uncharacterized protein n=1 Tax=Sporobolomyces salmoneus TaxID=183962 RepID=UPI003182A816